MTAPVKGSDIMAYAQSFVGVRWQHQGRSRNGIDCLGLIELTLRHFNLYPAELNDLPLDYTRFPSKRMMLEVRRRMSVLTKPNSGGIGLFKYLQQPYAFHIGFVGSTTLIHSDLMVGRVVEQSFRHPWTNRCTGIYAIPGVIDG